MKVLTSSSSSINPGVYRCRDDCERPSLPRRSSTFRPESWPKAKAKVAPIAVTYPARPAADRHRITMYVGSVFDRRLEAVSASSHRRQRTRSVWRPCAAKAICDAPFDRCPLTPPSTSAFAPAGPSCWSINLYGSIATLGALFGVCAAVTAAGRAATACSKDPKS